MKDSSSFLDAENSDIPKLFCLELNNNITIL